MKTNAIDNGKGRPGHRSRVERVPNLPGGEHSSSSSDELLHAWLGIRRASERLDRIARAEGWTTPFGFVRYLILAELARATAFGLSARRLAHVLSMPPSTLSHHLASLERSGMVERAPWTLGDRRKIAIRLTPVGDSVVRRMQLAQPPASSPAIASP